MSWVDTARHAVVWARKNGTSMAKRNLVWLAVIVAISLGLYHLAPMAARQDSVYHTYAPLVEVDALVRQQFVESIEDDRLIDGAIRGLMLQLDPYSGYISPDELPAYRRRAAGEYFGIGVQLGSRQGQPTVIAPIEQSPALEAGVRAGDVILAVDGRTTKGMGIADVDRLLDGDPGSVVELTVRHLDDGRTEELTIARAPVSLHSVKGFAARGDGDWNYLIDPEIGIAYIRVSNFHEHTAAEFDRALERLSHLEVHGLILDLRFNPGGSLRSAVAMADRFVDQGVIVSTVTRHRAVDTYRARHENTVPPWPMAVLINGASASASEIVAGALQDHERAVVVGSRSFGKGVVQSVVFLQRHPAAVSVTVAHYRLPNGRIVHKTPRNAATDAWGVRPDVVVQIDMQQMQAIQRRRMQVDGWLGRPTSVPAHDGVQGSQHAPTEILLDPQLSAALRAVGERLDGSIRIGSEQNTEGT